jgi:glutathione S-transferase
MDWSQSSLQPAFLTGVFLGFYRTPQALRNEKSIDENLARCAQHFQLLDRMLAERPFIAGDSLSLGDIAVGSNLYRYFELDIKRPDVPNVEAWYERLQLRPAFREHVMIPFDELFGRLNF